MTIKVEMEEREKPMIARRELLMGAAALPFAKAALAASPMGVATGPIEASWAGLAAGYRVPDWFRDAKFGIWAHWGPQCQPEAGDCQALCFKFGFKGGTRRISRRILA